MAAITQLVPNFLGGVSRQNDDKKLEGQVSECINGYPDPTYGLLKRPGMKFIDKLKDNLGNPFNKAALDGAIWHFIDRGAQGSYVSAIKGTNFYVWTLDGTWCTVTNTGTGYLTGTTSDHYHFRSIQDTTIVTNKSAVTAMQPAGTYVANSVATLKLVVLTAGSEYNVSINGVAAPTSTAQANTTFDDMLLYDAGNINVNHHLIDDLVAFLQGQTPSGTTATPTNFNGTWWIQGFRDNISIRRTDTNEASVNVVTNYIDTNTPVTGNDETFSITAKGGLNNTDLEAFQDEITDVSKLTVETYNGRHVKILNSNVAEDDYYVKFIATNGSAGVGSWQETLARNVSPGLDASTMPHALINTGATTFTFGPISWTDRLVGDDVTNPQPSFIGFKVNATFFYNNRFGMLSEDNIIFGVANDTYNFFAKSALTQIDSDPIDVNVSSVRPVTLTDVLPSPQGLVIFSGTQQFLVLATESGVLTPSSTLVRAVANYEMDVNISPVDVGTNMAFLSKVTDYSKLFYMQLRGVDENPAVVDISKIVIEWIPNTVDRLIVSPQNSLIALVDRSSSYIYMYRFYNNGERDVMQAWTKWQLTGTIQDANIIGDDLVVVSQHEDEYTLNTVTLDELPTGSVSLTTGNPCLDFYAQPVGTLVYDSTNDITKIYTPFTPITGQTGTVFVVSPDDEAGYSFKGVAKSDGTGPYFEVDKDQTGFSGNIFVGYDYNFEVTLPRFYFRRNEQTTDFTANLTISRVKVSVGRSGTVTFKTKMTSSKEWTDVKEVVSASEYKASSEPVKSEYQFVVPIHQRNINFELQVTSNQPYPVSLVSMMWEGNYSQRYYRRS